MSETITTGQKIGFGVVVIVILGLSICKLFFQNDDQQRKSRTIGKGPSPRVNALPPNRGG